MISSIIAAPIIIFDSLLSIMLKSLKTLAVIPIEVAVNVAPKKIYVWSENPGIRYGPAKYLPNKYGANTPIIATKNALIPIDFICFILDSNPT